MATIYRFVVEQGKSGNGGGRNSTIPSEKKPAKDPKGKWESILSSGQKGGVEHNRKTRAINPLLNKMTGGYWEKGMRVGRAGLGLVQKNSVSGKYRLSGTAVAIIIAFAIQTALKHNKMLQERISKENAQNYKKLETNQSAIHGAFKVSTNFWSGKVSYNENK